MLQLDIILYRKSYQEDLLEALENLPHHLPHLGNQLEDPERTQAAQHHQQLSPRLGRDVGGQPAQEDQAHLHKQPRVLLSTRESMFSLLLSPSSTRSDRLLGWVASWFSSVSPNSPKTENNCRNV